MTKKEMKQYLLEQIEKNWENVEHCDRLIALYEGDNNLTESGKYIFEMAKRDKSEYVGKCVALEDLYKTFFGVDYYDLKFKEVK